MAIRDDLCSRYISKGADRLGRWTYIKTRGKDNTVVTWVTVYQPCEGKPLKNGSMTVVTQQYNQLLEEKRPQPEKVRKHFRREFNSFLTRCRANKEHLIIGGDFNEVIGTRSWGMSELCRKHDLVDPIFHFHGLPEGHFATWIDGKTIIDYILISKELIPAVDACGYEAFEVRAKGDHRGMFIKFNTSKLYGSTTVKLAPLASRRLKSTNPQPN